MRFNCVHTFTIEAEDRKDFDAKLSHYRSLVDRASAKLDMGYENGWMQGQRDGPYFEPEPETPPERLFDDD